MNFGYLMLTLNNKVGGSLKWTTWKGCDAAGVRACICLFHISNYQRWFFNLHSALQKRLRNINSIRTTESNNDDFLSFWWLERPLNLSDFAVVLSLDEMAWQGDIMPDVSGHFRRDFDILWFENWQKKKKKKEKLIWYGDGDMMADVQLWWTHHLWLTLYHQLLSVHLFISSI